MKTPARSTYWGLQSDELDTWAYWGELFSPDECKHIIDIGNSYQKKSGVVGSKESEDAVYRDSKITWLGPEDDTYWIYERLTAAVNSLNKDLFKFNLSGFAETLQFTEYTAPAGHYDYHIDRAKGIITRKLSIVVQLTDPSEYEGGDLEILEGKDPQSLPREQGMLLLFPSYAVHRVTPVTKGTRNSLVGWITGEQFK